jgi:hypothetical protein
MLILIALRSTHPPIKTLWSTAIHNTNTYLAGNKLRQASNLVLYSAGAKVDHSGGGVANSGGAGVKVS